MNQKIILIARRTLYCEERRPRLTFPLQFQLPVESMMDIETPFEANASNGVLNFMGLLIAWELNFCFSADFFHERRNRKAQF